MQKGHLIFELRKDNGVTPVRNAQVKITSIDGREVNHLLNVNEDGKTNEIEIYTKDLNLTFDKSNKDIPYTNVNAEVRFEDSKIVYVEGIQVYSDVTSIQEIKFDNKKDSFRSIRDKKGKLKKEHIHIKNEPPCIFLDDEKKSNNISDEDEKIMKSVIKKNKVVIPEFITISIGDLNGEFEIITVPFIDYIKNVSCSCIYPTWRDEAIKANVYSIISFALNRIYTDWYRSKGYGFEITSSRSRDQMYVKSRNLFKNICNIVDEVFDSCIKISGIDQPFFSRCYNLTNDERKLSRWGSLDLAEDGLSALEILKKYFGDNIEISEVKNIGGIVKKYPKRELSNNSKGDDVKFIQKALNVIGIRYTGITKIPNEDGIFGKYTERAVMDFQRIFNLNVDGIVGNKTWNKISLLYTLTNKIFGDVISDIDYGSSILKIGSEGENVKNIQKSLNNILGDYKFFNKLKEDGYFGEKTESAVKQFQNIFGLVVDGIVGKNTLKRIEYVEKNINALKNFISRQLNDNNKPDNSEYRIVLNENDMIVPIKFGDLGENVRQLQFELNNLSKYYGFLTRIAEDGIFGDKTYEVVLKFQNKFSLIQDGIFGIESLRKLITLNRALKELSLDEERCNAVIKNVRDNDRDMSDKNVRPSFKAEYSMEYPNFDINFGIVCGYVTLIQKYINVIKGSDNNYFSNSDKLLEDGKFEENTLKHINEFQGKFNLNQSSNVDKTTWDKLVMEYEKIYSK